MKSTKELNRPFLLQVFTGVSVMALLVLTALGDALLMVLVALVLLIVGIVVFGREIHSDQAPGQRSWGSSRRVASRCSGLFWPR